MNPADVPRDPELPQLAIALDPIAMADVFAAASRLHRGSLLETCRIDRVKYRPRRNCSVSYRLQLRDADGRSFEQRVAARFCRAGESASRYRIAAANPLTTSMAGPTLTHSPALDMLAHWLPNDARIAAVAHLFDAERLRSRWLPALVDVLTEGRGRLLDQSITVTQYVPENRVCARVELRLLTDRYAAAALHTVYAKADAATRGAQTDAVMRTLTTSPAQRDGRLRTPRSLLWQPDAGLHWQEGLAGSALLDRGPQVDPAMAAAVGSQLAALHGTPVPTTRALTRVELIDRPRKAAALLALIEPRWRSRLARLVYALEIHAAGIDTLPEVTLHGDLHPRNILVDAGRLSVIDLDTVTRGPAAMDLGSWIADGLYRAVLAGYTAASAAPSRRAFVAAYLEGSSQAVSSATLAWSIAHHLLCERAYRAAVNLKPGRWATVPTLLAMATRIACSATPDAADECEGAAQ